MDLSSYEHLDFRRDGDVLVMTLNRPERLNAVNTPMRLEIVRAFLEMDDDESHAVVITGAGRAFSAGGDVQMFDDTGGMKTHSQFAQVRSGSLPRAQLDVEKPVIAMVRGVAVGLGATIALMCDIVVASDTARIGDRHVNVGLVAGDGGALMWPMLVGMNKAKELLMLGDLVSGDDLERLGLVNHLVADDELEDFTMNLAHRIAAMPPYAMKATKSVLNAQIREKISTYLDLGIAYEHYSAKMDDHLEASRAFIEKRQGVFKGS